MEKRVLSRVNTDAIPSLAGVSAGHYGKADMEGFQLPLKLET
jgi:hypothetical protein